MAVMISALFVLLRPQKLFHEQPVPGCARLLVKMN